MSNQKQTKKIRTKLIIEIGIIALISFVFFIFGLKWWIPLTIYFGIIGLMGLWYLILRLYTRKAKKKYRGWFEKERTNI